MRTLNLSSYIAELNEDHIAKISGLSYLRNETLSVISPSRRISNSRSCTPGLIVMYVYVIRTLLSCADNTQMEELSKARESLVGAETSRTHLQERVDELSRQLQGNQEKLSVYERRPSSVSGVPQSATSDSIREHQFESEVAELRYVLLFNGCTRFT